jgi:hypothetical protein
MLQIFKIQKSYRRLPKHDKSLQQAPKSNVVSRIMVTIQASGFETKKKTIFRQPSLLFAGLALASFAKRGEGSRKSGLFWPKWEPPG